jgi:hypothetical protein
VIHGRDEKKDGREAVSVHDGQKIEHRERTIALLQDGQVHLIIVNAEAGVRAYLSMMSGEKGNGIA